MRRYLNLLRQQRHYRNLWFGQVISLTGDWFNTIAIVIIVQRYIENSGLAVSALFLARTLPLFFGSTLAGVVADRFDRKWIIVYSNLVRVFIVLGLLLVDSPGKVWLIYVLTLAQFTASAFFEPAYAAIIPSLVPKDDLLTANTLGSVTWSAMLALGAAIGGVVANVAGVTVALLVDAATFAVAAALTVSVQAEYAPEATPSQHNNRWQELVEGLVYVRQRLNIALVVLVKALTQVGTADVAIAVYAKRVFVVGEDGAITLGVLFAAFGLGAIAGPLLGDFFNNGSENSLKNWISIGFIFVAVGWFIFGVAPTLEIAAVGMLLRGMGGSLNWTYSSVLIQMEVPNQFLGRVFGLDFTLFTLALSAATVLTGFMLDTLQLDPRSVSIYIAVGSALPTLLWLVALQKQRQRRATRQLLLGE